MPLVSPLPTDADQEVAELAKFFNETLGFCPNSVLTMQRRPAMARAFIQLNKAVMENHGRVTSELKRMIGYITSMAGGCRRNEILKVLARSTTMTIEAPVLGNSFHLERLSTFAIPIRAIPMPAA